MDYLGQLPTVEQATQRTIASTEAIIEAEKRRERAAELKRTIEKYMGPIALVGIIGIGIMTFSLIGRK